MENSNPENEKIWCAVNSKGWAESLSPNQNKWDKMQKDKIQKKDLKIQMEQNTNGTKYKCANAKIQTQQNTKEQNTNCQNTNVT